MLYCHVFEKIDRGEEEAADLHLASLINTNIGCDESTGAGVKTEILRILAGQVTTLTAMADVSFFWSFACLSLIYNVVDTSYSSVCQCLQRALIMLDVSYVVACFIHALTLSFDCISVKAEIFHNLAGQPLRFAAMADIGTYHGVLEASAHDHRLGGVRSIAGAANPTVFEKTEKKRQLQANSSKDGGEFYEEENERNKGYDKWGGD
ncbi:hypothetical protein Tco_1199839 [Tanacetum coccineum]